jgi:hypothetical protein
MLTNAKETPAKMGAFALIWWPTTPVNVQGNTWEGTANTVSTMVSPFNLFKQHIFPVLFEGQGQRCTWNPFKPILNVCIKSDQ